MEEQLVRMVEAKLINQSINRSQLQNQGRCFICLRTGHVYKECSTSLSPVFIVKGLDIIIEVFVQQSLKAQMKVILRKLLLTLVQLTLINHHNLMRKILNLQKC